MLERTKEVASLARDVGLILGVPTIIAVAVSLYDIQFKAFDQQLKANEAQIKVLEAQTALAKETQYDRAAALIKGQKEIYDVDRAQIINKLDALSKELDSNKSNLHALENLYEREHDCITKVVASLKSNTDEISKVDPTKMSSDSFQQLNYLSYVMMQICSVIK